MYLFDPQPNENPSTDDSRNLHENYVGADNNHDKVHSDQPGDTLPFTFPISLERMYIQNQTIDP
jgi:hypothetical protein